MNMFPTSTGLIRSSHKPTRQKAKSNFNAPEEISLHKSMTKQIAKSSAYTLNSVSFEKPGASQRSKSSSKG